MQLPILAALVPLLALSACAVTPEPAAAPAARSPAAIAVERLAAQPDGARCALRLAVQNRMSVPWIGFSYHVVFRSKSGQAVGESRGIPMRFMDPGTAVSGNATAGTRCEELGRVDVEYFGYYPSNGGAQVQLRPSLVTALLK